MEYLNKDLIAGYSAIDITKYALATYIGYKTSKWAYWRYKNAQVKARARAVYQSRNAKTYDFKQVDNEQLILSLDAAGLRDHMIKGTFTCSDVVNVYAKRSYIHGREMNLTTEENFEEALRDAEIKDKEIQHHRQNNTTHLLPKLHGVPISVKEIVSTVA